MVGRCFCDEAVRNRESERPLPETTPPNEDGEITCYYCWEVVGIVKVSHPSGTVAA